MSVAKTILQQMGGRVGMMTGAKDFLDLGNGVKFSLPRGSAKDKINMVKITLNGNDLYDIEFLQYRPRKFDVVTVKECNDIYCDMLKEIFEENTGLYLSFR